MGVISYEVPINAQRMTIGVQGENNVREFLFDVTEWRQITGDIGAAEMVVQRNGDSSPYATVITMKDENTVSWIPTDIDTAKAGAGKIELMWIANNQTVKTKIFLMKVDPSLPYAVPDDSLDPWQSWMPDIINADAKVKSLENQVATMQEQLANPFTFKGSVSSVANLPSSGNTINDTYYVTAETCLYTWDGDSWEVSSLSEDEYLANLDALNTKYDTNIFGLEDTIGPQLDGYIRDDGTFVPNASWKSLMVDASLVIFDGMVNLVDGHLNYYSDYISAIAYFDADMNLLYGSKYNRVSPHTYIGIPAETAFVVFNSSSDQSTEARFSIAFASLRQLVSNQQSRLNDMSVREIVLTGGNNTTVHYQRLFVRKGDLITVKAAIPNKIPRLWYSNGSNDVSYAQADLISSDLYNSTFAATGTWAGFSAQGQSGTSEATWTITITVRSLLPLLGPKDTVTIAAADSSLDDKRTADFVCEGENDQTVINTAIKLAKSSAIPYVELCNGTYYVDGFARPTIYNQSRPSAIYFHHVRETNPVILRGQADGKPRGAVIQVRAAAFDGLEEGEVLNVITGGPVATGYQGGQGFSLENLQIRLPDTNHPCVAVNCQWSYWGMLKNVGILANGYGAGVVPVDGSVGIRGWAGWSDGIMIGMEDVIVQGFRVGYQMSGEHAVLIRCIARYNYYGWTFGEYESDITRVAQVHPITLINCCDEHSAALPKFCKSGWAETPADGRCAVDMVSFNIEDHPLEYSQGKQLIRAMEDTDGGWVGRIDYTIDSNGYQNRVSVPFWADGHGKNFRTTNSAQAEMGTTATRRSYAANYMQRYYDEDLGKVVFCIDPTTKRWVDANGNDVD